MEGRVGGGGVLCCFFTAAVWCVPSSVPLVFHFSKLQKKKKKPFFSIFHCSSCLRCTYWEHDWGRVGAGYRAGAGRGGSTPGYLPYSEPVAVEAE